MQGLFVKDIVLPQVIVIDRDLTLMNALECIFPSSTNLLCQFHIAKNVKAKCNMQVKNEEDSHKVLDAWLYFWSFDLVEFFPSLFKQPICMIQQCFNQFVVMKTIYYKKFPSFVFDMPHFSNRHLYFLLLVVLRSNLSLYCLYFLPFSQANKTKVFLPIFDLSMTITNLSFFLTSQTYLNKSPLSVKT